MTKKEADEEARKIIAKRNRKAERIIQKAKDDGIWKPGLDTNQELLRDLDKEIWNELQELANSIDEQ
nr:hypothetical protein [uncultured Lachnoanaerobaculum sp.]DAU25608.1 MAG TPA: hypothetical protein [Caudoviricetes sp.]